MRLVSLAYGLRLADKSTKWREMPLCTEVETVTLDGMPTTKLVGSTYRGTSLETSYVYVFCAYKIYGRLIIVQFLHERLLPWAITY